jgi:phage shock protein PspC (stress-responsive transcriptional regulator)
MAGPKTRFYVDKRHKKVSGVCAGLPNISVGT